MLSRGWLEVDLGAVVRNARALTERSGVPLIPMVKADAYGMGAVAVARALEPMSPLAFGVATVGEGAELRRAGIERQVIVFTPLLEEDLELAYRERLTPTLGYESEIRAWARFGEPYVLSIDTGMSRAGLPWREAASIREVVRGNPPAAAFTHFHSADCNYESIAVQESRFREALSCLPVELPVVHTDASAAIARHSHCPLHAVRPGIFLYGVGSGEDAQLQPDPVVRVQAPVVECRWIEAGDSVSYEAAYVAATRREVATLSIGYADGYPRNAGSGGSAIIRGRRVPILGRVTMDMIMIDVTGLDVAPGETATLIGDPREAGAQDVATVARLAGMSPYEVLTGLRGRLERVYRNVE
jgi:alanine racemase